MCGNSGQESGEPCGRLCWGRWGTPREHVRNTSSIWCNNTGCNNTSFGPGVITPVRVNTSSSVITLKQQPCSRSDLRRLSLYLGRVMSLGPRWGRPEANPHSGVSALLTGGYLRSSPTGASGVKEVAS